jgi:hypothetical protein
VALFRPGPAGYTTWIDQVPGDRQVRFRNSGVNFGVTKES